MSEREQLINTLQTLNKEIALLRENLNKVGKEREEWFTRKENLKRRVANLIAEMKNVRELRDSSAKEMTSFTVKRDEANTKVSQLIKRYNELYYERKKVYKQHNVKYYPEKLKKDIEYYETMIETEALSFKKEKKLMDYIKQLKKLYDETKVAAGVLHEMNRISKDIEDTKKNANECHSKIYDCYYKNKKSKKDFKNLSGKITVFNQLQEEAFNTFVKLKEQCNAMNRNFREKLNESVRISKQLNQLRKGGERRKEDEKRRLIEAKRKSVEEKLRSKKKLTNEDLLVFQDK